MVVSKRCKICAALDAKNIPISGEYFGKLLPKLVERICGIELDERKINGVLICLHCAIELVHTDVVIDKLRSSVQRLKKTTKTKTPSKGTDKRISNNNPAVNDTKIDLINGTTIVETPTKTNGEDIFQNTLNDTKPLEEKIKLKTPKKADGRKSVFTDYTPKFNKIPDKETFIESTPTKIAKRKPESIADPPESIIDSVDNNATYEDLSKPKKRSKTISLSVTDQSLVAVTTNEQDLDEKRTKRPKVNNCVICGKHFLEKSELRKHFDACHMGERLKECPHCSMEFRSQQKYDSHVFKEKCKNTIHPCQYPKCNKHFKSVYKMELHMQEKHSSQNESETD